MQPPPGPLTRPGSITETFPYGLLRNTGGGVKSCVERGLFDIRKLFNGEGRLAWGGGQGGTAVSPCLTVWAFQMEWLLLLVGLLKWREC